MNAAVIVGACALLVARPALLRMGPPVLIVTLLFTAILLAATLVRQAAPQASSHTKVVMVLLVGIAAFAVGRIITGDHAPAAFSVRFVLLNSLAAVAEEALFRRVVYSALAPVGAAFAIGGAAVLFALVHVSVYGAWVLPLDVAAGVLFGWQRWATNRWSVPAVTHVAANVFVVV